MKIAGYILIFLFTMLFLACKDSKAVAQKEIEMKYQDVVEEEETSNFSLKESIGDKKFNLISISDSLKISEIKKVVVDESTQAYGRKNSFIKTTHFQNDALQVDMANDLNYEAVDEAAVIFEPSYSFQFGEGREGMFVMLDPENSLVSFINTDGQVVLRISEKLKNKLLKLANE